MTDVVVDTLRLRGAHGRRLARVAARALPAALDRALADVDDVTVASVRVVLDLDPEEYDDETLAVLWADLVRAELVARAGGTTVRSATPRASRPLDTRAASARVDVAASARAWLSLPEGGRTGVPAPLLRLGDPAVAAPVAVALGSDGWNRLVASLREVLPLPAAMPPSESGDEVDRAPGPAEPGAAGPVVAAAPAPPPAAPGAVRTGHRAGGADVPDEREPAAARDADALAALRMLDELHADRPTPLDPGTLTRAAGLVLLYPWLADHCAAAEELHPGLDRYDVRAAALAALVADPAAVEDPLVRMLAGRALPAEPPRDRFELPHQDEVDASAERVLASFVSLLPGFERSTPEFVRSTWLVRLGVLDLERQPAVLTAATHPLDVLLPVLPYPLGLFKLPWSAALTVRFRP